MSDRTDMSSSKACARCRSKKLRCDRSLPNCGMCSKINNGTATCVYDRQSRMKRTSILKKGGACIPCRQKRAKCDGQRPFCGTCESVGKQFGCQYTGEQPYAQKLQHKSEILELQLACYEAPNSYIKNVVTANSVISFDNFPQAAFDNLYPPESYPYQTLTSNKADQGTFTQYTSFTLHSIYPQRHLADLSLIEEYRAIFLTNRMKFGLQITEAQATPILNGDITGRIVDPALVHVASLLGFILWKADKSTIDVSGEHLAREAQEAVDSINARPSIDPTAVQALCCFVAYNILCDNKIDAEIYLGKAVNAVTKMDALSPTGRVGDSTEPPPFPEDGTIWLANSAKRWKAAFNQLLFMERSSTMALNSPLLMKVDVESQLPAVEDILTDDNSLYNLRLRCVDLLVRTRQAIVSWQITEKDDIERSALIGGYWKLLREATVYVGILEVATLRISLSLNHEAVMVAKLTLFMALTAKARIHALLMPHADSRRMAIDGVMRIVQLCDELRSDYKSFDFVSSACLALVGDLLLHERRWILASDSTGTVDKLLFKMISCYCSLEQLQPWAYRAQYLVDCKHHEATLLVLNSRANANTLFNTMMTSGCGAFNQVGYVSPVSEIVDDSVMQRIELCKAMFMPRLP